MPLELKQFLLTGQLGPVSCGLTMKSVLAKFGEPEYSRNLYHADGSIREVRFDYEGLGLCFEKDCIAQYGLHMEEGVGIPKFLEPVGYFPLGGNVPMHEFLDYLKNESIPFRERYQNEDNMFKVFTKGEVGVGGRNTVLSLILPCPGTERWHSIKNREKYKIDVTQLFGAT
jgi:hypothetical protein